MAFRLIEPIERPYSTNLKLSGLSTAYSQHVRWEKIALPFLTTSLNWGYRRQTRDKLVAIGMITRPTKLYQIYFKVFTSLPST